MNTQKSYNTNVLSLMIALLGFVIIYVTSEKTLITNYSEYSYFVGTFFLFSGIFAFIWNDEIKFEIDGMNENIHYKSWNILGSTKKVVAFREVEKVLVHRIGKAANYTSFYFTSIKLRNKRILKTGHFFLDESDAYHEAQKMADAFGCSKMEDSPAFYVTNKTKILLTILANSSAFIFYLIYYRMMVGEWSASMWFGMLPAIFILVSALAFFSIFVRLRN